MTAYNKCIYVHTTDNENILRIFRILFSVCYFNRFEKYKENAALT